MIDVKKLKEGLETLKLQQKQAEGQWQKTQGAIEYSESLIKEAELMDVEEKKNTKKKELK